MSIFLTQRDAQLAENRKYNVENVRGKESDDNPLPCRKNSSSPLCFHPIYRVSQACNLPVLAKLLVNYFVLRARQVSARKKAIGRHRDGTPGTHNNRVQHSHKLSSATATKTN